MSSKLRKITTLIVAFAMLIGIMVPAQVVKAEETDLLATEIKVDYANETIEIASATDLGSVYLTDKYDGSDEAKAAKAVWDEYTLTSKDSKYVASIDFSGYTKATADSVLYVKGKKTVFPIKINKQNTDIKALYSGIADPTVKGISGGSVALTDSNSFTATDCGYIFFTDGKGTITQYTDISKLQWRKGTSGAWKSSGSLKLNNYVNRGAVLYFRIAATATPSAISVGTGDDKDVYVTEGNRTSKEVKVSFAKRAKAPSLKVDGNKLTIPLKKGQEYQINGTDGEWIDVLAAHGVEGKVGKITLDQLYTSYTDKDNNTKFSYVSTTAANVYVRTAATAKKMCSKETKIELNATANPSAVSGSFTVALTDAADASKGLTFTNASDKEIQYAIVAKADVVSGSAIDQSKVIAKALSNDLKWTNVKAVKDGKNGTSKYSYAKYKELTDPVIVYRLASVKANGDVKFQTASLATTKAAIPTTVTAGALDVTVATGSAAGTTKATATAGEGNSLVYQIGSAEVTGINAGKVLSGTTYKAYKSGDDIAIDANQWLTVYEIDKDKKVVKFKSVKVEAANIKPADAEA